MITRVTIKNFRSIERQEIAANKITTFVGENDAGKSNVLRALNLFFNGKTDSGLAFDFNRDFNKFAHVPRRKAKQIEIGIRFRLPSGYMRDEHPEEIEWTKVWRTGGPVQDLEKRVFVGGKEFPSRSKIGTMLHRVRYNYVPAIKDTKFFADLQGRLYEVLASVATKTLRKSANDFEVQIQDHLGELLKSLSETFKSDSVMRLPEDLRQIFENLEFSSNEIPLSRRGDGIKVRHIPSILKFVAEKENSILSSGGVRYFHIWGFEEPENNVEMSACFDMATQFGDLATQSERYQIFLTTHSPAFYGMGTVSDEDKMLPATTHFVHKEENRTSITMRRRQDVDELMGLMPLVSPYIMEAKAKFDDLQAEHKKIKGIAAKETPTLFVEGESDKIVFERAIRLFAPDLFEILYIYSGSKIDYGSANAVSSRALAWTLEMRHRSEDSRIPAAALFDGDEAGAAARKQLQESLKRLEIKEAFVKAILLPLPPQLRDLAKRGFRLGASIESYYPDSTWWLAQKRGWLSEIGNPQDLLTRDMLVSMIRKEGNAIDELSDSEKLRVLNCFSKDAKIKAAKRIAAKDDAGAKKTLRHLEPVVETLRKHFL